MNPKQEKKYYKPQSCKKCGGACCKTMGGIYISQDFNKKITVAFITSLLKKGKVAIDWWEGDAAGKGRATTYFLRARHKSEPEIYPSWGGICVNWSLEKGCVLSKEERPYQCRMLIPKFIKGEIECDYLKKDKAEKRDCAIAWYEHQKTIEKVIAKFPVKQPSFQERISMMLDGLKTT